MHRHSCGIRAHRPPFRPRKFLVRASNLVCSLRLNLIEHKKCLSLTRHCDPTTVSRRIFSSFRDGEGLVTVSSIAHTTLAVGELFPCTLDSFCLLHQIQRACCVFRRKLVSSQKSAARQQAKSEDNRTRINVRRARRKV